MTKSEQRSVAFSLGILRSFVQAFVVRGNVMASGLTIWAGLAIGYTGWLIWLNRNNPPASSVGIGTTKLLEALAIAAPYCVTEFSQ
jgi:hypothetical protein